MTAQRLDLVFLGLSLSSSSGNGHATTYQRAAARPGRTRPSPVVPRARRSWYAAARDLAQPEFCRLEFYHGVADLEARFGACIAAADAGPRRLLCAGRHRGDRSRARSRRLCAFYDIDTPVTVASLLDNRCAYLGARQIPALDLYLSFTGGPLLQCLEQRFGARLACPLYCSVDAARYRKQAMPVRWDLGYLGTYAEDRQPALQRLLIEPARLLPERRFVVAGAQYPASIEWPTNVERIEHVPPADHAAFYCQQRFTLNVTRADMRCGWSPSVRLFEAASCGTPIISDRWDELDALLPEGEAVIVATGARMSSPRCTTPTRQSATGSVPMPAGSCWHAIPVRRGRAVPRPDAGMTVSSGSTTRDGCPAWPASAAAEPAFAASIGLLIPASRLCMDMAARDASYSPGTPFTGRHHAHAAHQGRLGRRADRVGRGGGALADQMLARRASDIVLALAYGRTYREVIGLFAEARRLRLAIVLVSETANSALAKWTNVVLVIPRGKPKPLPTFSDALATVRRELWTPRNFETSSQQLDIAKYSESALNRLIKVACYAA